MSNKIVVEYNNKEVPLSRVYPFGTTKNVDIDGKTKEVTVVTINELNGKDEELIEKNSENKSIGFVTISVSAGITYDEVLMLATKDSNKIIKELQGF